MPLPQIHWENRVGKQLIAEQHNYDLNALHQIVENGERTLTDEQRAVYDAMLEKVENNQAGGSFLHSAGGCGKTYVCNLLAAAVRAREKIVLCVASSGIASLLLSGGRTAHSRFKIPIPINEASTCNIKKDDPWHELLLHTSLIIWDEVPMQHRHVIECVDRSLCDLRGVDADFGGIPVLFVGDFRQTLPVVPHGSREHIVGATFCRSQLWGNIRVFKLETNMRLGRDPICDQFAEWLLQIGAGIGMSAENEVTLPEYMCCGNDMHLLIDALYGELLDPTRDHALPNDYFLDRTILSAKNVEVNEINSTVLASFTGETTIYTSVDSVTEKEYDYIPTEFLHTLDPSGFPLHQLELKNGAPLMLLQNLDPSHGLYSGTRMILVSSTQHVLQCRVLRKENEGVEGGDNDIVLIPRMALDAPQDEFPVPLRHLQFPVRLAFSITINKSQGQSVKYVGLDLHTPVFSHGQLYVALSRCTHPHRVKAIFPQGQNSTLTTNVVFTEVLRNLI